MKWIKLFEEYEQVDKVKAANVIFNNFVYYKKSINRVYHAMSYEYNTDIPENKEAMLWIKEWVSRNFNELKSKSTYYVSNKGSDFLEVSKKLECSPDHIIGYIDMYINEEE